MRRRIAASVLGFIVLLTFACAPGTGPDSADNTTPPKGVPSADNIASSLATGLEELDVDKVAMTDAKAAQEDLETIFAGMDGLAPKVEVKRVEYSPEGEEATVKFSNTYPTAGSDWSFESSAELALADDKWQLEWSPKIVHPKLTDETRLRHQRTFPKRAAINDSDGQALMEVRSVYQIGIDKTQVSESDWEDAAEDLAKLLDIDADSFKEKVLAGGPEQFVVGKTMQQEDINPDIGQVPGAQVVTKEGTVGPDDGFAASILGTVGKPTAEQLEESDGELLPDDVVGLSGLQARYDERLSGVPEVDIDIVQRNLEEDSAEDSEDDFEEENLFHQDSSVGEPLELSLDRELQIKAEEALADQKGIATLVVIRPEDSALLVAANSPENQYPNATFGNYAPGSTFKVVSALAMLRDGASPDSTVECPNSLDVAGHSFGNYSDYPSSMTGTITLRQALAHSCNTAFVGAAESVSAEDLHAAAASLGVGTDYDAGFTSNFGTVDPQDAKIDLAASMIGQGQVTMSPLGMAAVAASVASGETTIPWLVEGQEAKPDADPLTDEEAAALQEMMSAVVTEGTGNVLSGVMTGAKTGTAEFGKAGEQQTHAWMIAWNDDYAVSAFVEVGKSGSEDAAPLIKALFS